MTGCESEKPISFCRKFLFSSAALAAILFSIYSNSFDCGWHLDDFHSITDNPSIHLENLTWEDVRKTLHSDLNYPEKLYRPVAGLTLALNYFVSGTDPASYHLVNLLIHWLSSVFLFLFIHRTLNLPSLKGKYVSSAYPIALLSATLWAINPVQTQSVTYIVQRMASLAGMFYIMSMYFYMKARTSMTGSQSRFLFGFFVRLCPGYGLQRECAPACPEHRSFGITPCLRDSLMEPGEKRKGLHRDFGDHLPGWVAVDIPWKWKCFVNPFCRL